MTGCVDQVELIGKSVDGAVHHPHGFRLDSDALLALKVHLVEDLRREIALRDRAGHLKQPVGERGLPVIDVRDDAEVADAFARDHQASIAAGAPD